MSSDVTEEQFVPIFYQCFINSTLVTGIMVLEFGYKLSMQLIFMSIK